MLSYLACRLAFTAIVLQPGFHPAPAQSRPVQGITYTVDTATGYGPLGAMLGQLALRVTYAGTRGRIDVVARAERPAIRSRWVILAPLAVAAGDYFLFDSTSFVLVRPSRKDLVRFGLADVSFNYESRRDRWPMFGPEGLDADTIPGRDRVRGWRGDFTIYWHAELMRDTSCTSWARGNCEIRGLSLGRTTVVAAPAELLSIARWFGPTAALARIAGLQTLIDRPIHLTAIGYWTAPGGGVTQLTANRFLSSLRQVTVDPKTLTLPRGYKVTPWQSRRGSARPGSFVPSTQERPGVP